MLGAADILALALSCAPQVDAGTVHAIVARESRGNPFAIGVGKQASLSHQPASRPHALHVAGELQKAGIEFDVGLAQIRTTNLRKFGISVEQALEPCTSLRLMEAILVENYTRAVKTGRKAGAEASLAALSAYNTGSFSSGFANGYVSKVIQAYPSRHRATPTPQK